jgi:hypothetical protein
MLQSTHKLDSSVRQFHLAAISCDYKSEITTETQKLVKVCLLQVTITLHENRNTEQAKILPSP